MAIKTHKVTLSLDNPRVIQSGINVQSFDKQSIQISIELTKNDEVFQVPSDATIRVSLLKLARQEQKIIVDVPNTNRESIDWIVPDYLDGYQGTVRVGVYLVSGTENVDLGYFTILSNVSDIDKMADEFVDNVFQGWEQIEADLNELNLTIAQTKLDLAEDLTQIDNTIANINAKNTQVNTLASDFTADVATKQSDVTSKYNAFDTSVTTANQTIDDILALQPQFQAVLDETTGKDVISAPEIILARNGEVDLKTRLDKEKQEVTAQLAQTTTGLESIEKANAEDTINLTNYLGNRQNIHPKVLSFDTEWNGYMFWMAYTPYPQGKIDHENPCIAVSNDLFNWTVPSGVTNPLDPIPPTGFNSDTHLIYREDTGVMEIWWRWVNTANNTRTIYRRTSTDGVNWTSKEVVMETSYGGDVISPAVIFEDGKYKIWFVNEGSSRGVYYMESIGDTISQWSDSTLVPIDWGSLTPWHPDIIKSDLGYELITTAYSPGNNNNSSDLYYVLIDNDGVIHKPQLILARSKNVTAIDHVGIYRSSILKYKNKYYVYYSSISKNGDRNMSVSYGDSIFGLNGFKNNDLKKIGNRTMSLSSGVINDLNVKDIDLLSLGPNTNVTIEGLSGGWAGKKLTIVLTSSSAKVILKNNYRLNMPFNRDFTFDSSKGFVLELVCQDADGTYWRPIIHHLAREVLSFNTPQTLTNLDVNSADVLALYGGTPSYIIESLVGGYAGKTLDIVLFGGTSNNVIIKHSANMKMPGDVDYHLKASEKRGVRLVWYTDTVCIAMT